MKNNENNETNLIVSDSYDTAVKDIGGLKDYSLIFNILESHFQNSDSLDLRLNQQNQFDIRTEKTRKKVEWAINKSILRFVNQGHKDLIEAIFQQETPSQDKKFAFFWQFALNNRLFRELSVQVFSKVYYSGRAAISKDDIIAYMDEFLKHNSNLDLCWSQETVYRVSTKFLNLMTKLDFVSSGRIKTFKHIRPSSEAQVLFLYFARLFAPTMRNILTNEFLQISFISSEDIQKRLKKLSMKGLFDMNFNGIALNIELTHSYKGICDALYNRP
jgi:hypothetical protein